MRNPSLSPTLLASADFPGPRYHLEEPLPLDSGALLANVTIAYEIYGTLNADKSNAILVCHALTGDQYAASSNPITGKTGWWHLAIGAGKPIDTDKYFVICSNVLGSCCGSTGPRDTNPITGKPYGTDFPTVTIGDMVRAQEWLVTKHLGIEKLVAVVGASMGGMQALQWATAYPDKMHSVVAIACSYRHTAQNIAFHEVGRQAIIADLDWHSGAYLSKEATPHRGLAVARMAAHITYLSESALHEKFGRKLQNRETISYGFEADFQVESYLRHQGMTFVDRFDANSYLYLTRAVDYFDLSADYGGNLAKAFSDKPRYCIISLSSDWLFPTSEHKAIVRALNAVAANVSFVEIETQRGHDAFLLHEPEFHTILRSYLQTNALQTGL